MVMNRSNPWTEQRIDDFMNVLDRSVAKQYHDPRSWHTRSGKDMFFSASVIMFAIPEYWKAMFDSSVIMLWKREGDKPYPIRRIFCSPNKGVVR